MTFNLNTKIARLINLIGLAVASGAEVEADALRAELMGAQLRNGTGFAPGELTASFGFSESNHIEDGWTGTLVEAEAVLASALDHVGNYDKTDFTITTPDGSVYAGMITLCADDYSIIEHVRRACSYRLARPEGDLMAPKTNEERRAMSWWLAIMDRASVAGVGDVITVGDTVKAEVYQATRALRGKCQAFDALDAVNLLRIDGRDVQGRGRNRHFVVTGALPDIRRALEHLTLEGTILAVNGPTYTVSVATSRPIGTLIID